MRRLEDPDNAFAVRELPERGICQRGGHDDKGARGFSAGVKGTESELEFISRRRICLDGCLRNCRHWKRAAENAAVRYERWRLKNKRSPTGGKPAGFNELTL